MPEASSTSSPAAPSIESTSSVAAPVKTAEDKLHERAAALIEKSNAPVAEEPAAKAELDIDPETLSKLTKESEKRRAAEKRAETAEARAKELEGGAGDMATLRDAKKLWSEGSRFEAMQKLSGVEDPSSEIEDLLQKWLKVPAKGEPAIEETVKALREQAAANAAELAEAKKDREERAAEKKAAADRTNAEAFSGQMRDLKGADGAARYPLASAPENAGEAAKVALEKANAKLLKLGVKEVTRELAEHLFELAYAEIEANLTKAKPAAKIEATSDGRRAQTVPRAGTMPQTKTQYARTPEGASKALHERAAELLRRRQGA